MVQREIKVILVRQVHRVFKVKLVHRVQKVIRATHLPTKTLHRSSF